MRAETAGRTVHDITVHTDVTHLELCRGSSLARPIAVNGEALNPSFGGEELNLSLTAVTHGQAVAHLTQQHCAHRLRLIIATKLALSRVNIKAFHHLSIVQML